MEIKLYQWDNKNAMTVKQAADFFGLTTKRINNVIGEIRNDEYVNDDKNSLRLFEDYVTLRYDDAKTFKNMYADIPNTTSNITIIFKSGMHKLSNHLGKFDHKQIEDIFADSNEVYENATFLYEFTYQDKKLRVAIMNGTLLFFWTDVIELFNIPSECLAGGEGLWSVMLDVEDMDVKVQYRNGKTEIAATIDKDRLYAIAYEMEAPWQIRRWLMEFVMPFLDANFSHLTLFAYTEEDYVKLSIINGIGQSDKLYSEMN